LSGCADLPANGGSSADEGGGAEGPPVASVAIDLRPLLNKDIEEVRHLFGVQTGSNDGLGMFYVYHFENGLDVAVDETIVSFFVDFSQAADRTLFHFSGIDGTSTHDDVVAMFGDQPYAVRDGAVGAVQDFGYWVAEYEFVYFSIDANDNVSAIMFFQAHRN